MNLLFIVAFPLFTGRVLKSNSRAHVPQALKGISQSAVSSERNSANLANTNVHHRRTKSEAPSAATVTKLSEPKRIIEARPAETSAKSKTQTIKIADVRPRYLEPKKVHTASNALTSAVGGGPVRSSTSSSIPANLSKKQHNYQQSSSESSRHSSPAARKHLNGKVATIKSTNNMSLDSLTSNNCRPTRSKNIKSSDNERFSDINVDSLNESMKSSVITNKTASRESLLSNRLGRPTKLKSEILLNNQNSKAKAFNGAIKPARPTSLGPRAPKYLQQKVTSTGSSPSSVTTTKSATSRLSSVSSNQSSRDFYKRSISVPGQTDSSQSSAPKHSFLSAKSREILARRAEKEKNKQQEVLKQSQPTAQQQKEHSFGGSVMRSASHSSVMANRNNIPSNIPTRRPNSLQLKKNNNAKPNGNHHHQSNNIAKNRNASSNQIHNSNEIYQSAQAVKQKIELLIKTSSSTSSSSANKARVMMDDMHAANDHHTSIAVESKLERSSTFCKDSAEVDAINELHIIE